MGRHAPQRRRRLSPGVRLRLRFSSRLGDFACPLAGRNVSPSREEEKANRFEMPGSLSGRVFTLRLLGVPLTNP